MLQIKRLTLFFETIDLERMDDLFIFIDFQLHVYGVCYIIEFKECFVEGNAWDLLLRYIKPENIKTLSINNSTKTTNVATEQLNLVHFCIKLQ
jgi:Herpes virus proteins UL24 and UL76